jgi:hypothetical protein
MIKSDFILLKVVVLQINKPDYISGFKLKGNLNQE